MEGSKNPTKTVGSCCYRVLGDKLRQFAGFFQLVSCPHYFFNSMYGLKYLQICRIKNLNLSAVFFYFKVIFSLKHIKDSRFLCSFIFRDIILKCYRGSGYCEYIFLYYIPSFHLACMCTPNVMFYQQFINWFHSWVHRDQWCNEPFLQLLPLHLCENAFANACMHKFTLEN